MDLRQRTVLQKILLNESGIESAKTNKAQQMEIKIYNNIKQLIKEN